MQLFIIFVSKRIEMLNNKLILKETIIFVKQNIHFRLFLEKNLDMFTAGNKSFNIVI